jgi:lysine 6-dehydrogenase
MRIIFLGGSGEMAAAMLPIMRDDDAVKHVTLADIDGNKADAKAREFGQKFTGRQVDAANKDELVAAMKGHDVAISYIGPFYKFEKPVGEAAIEAGVPIVSIADDYDAFLAVWELEEKAKAAGVKILTGFGNSPGLTQVLAKKGYLSMEKPEAIYVNWAAGANEAVGAANLFHVMHFMNGNTVQWRDGKRVEVKSGDGKKTVLFPQPIGEIPVFFTGHAESVTLPMFLPNLKTVTLHGGCVPTWIFPFVAYMGKLGLTSTHERRKRLLKIMNPIIPFFSSKKDPDKSVGRVEVFGYNKGQETLRFYTYVGHIADITSIPCFLAAKWLVQGKFKNKPGGVYPAERLLDDPDEFLKELRSMGLEMEFYD